MGERREVTLAQHGREKGGNISTTWEREGENTLAQHGGGGTYMYMTLCMYLYNMGGETERGGGGGGWHTS